MKSRRHRALEEIGRRLRLIAVANGFRTEAGSAVFMGQEVTFGPGDSGAAIDVVVGEDEVLHQGENVGTAVPVHIHALVKASIADPLLSLEEVIADVKQAVEQSDRTLGGVLVQRGLDRVAVRPREREEGSEFVGAIVEYRMTLAEQWGNP
jgi:hypothetical protein